MKLKLALTVAILLIFNIQLKAEKTDWYNGIYFALGYNKDVQDSYYIDAQKAPLMPKINTSAFKYTIGYSFEKYLGIEFSYSNSVGDFNQKIYQNSGAGSLASNNISNDIFSSSFVLKPKLYISTRHSLLGALGVSYTEFKTNFEQYVYIDDFGRKGLSKLLKDSSTAYFLNVGLGYEYKFVQDNNVYIALGLNYNYNINLGNENYNLNNVFINKQSSKTNNYSNLEVFLKIGI